MASSSPKLFILLLAIFFSHTWAVNPSNASPTTLQTNLTSLKSFCRTTPYPDVCFNSLKLSISININPNIINNLLQSLQVAISKVTKLSDLFNNAGTGNIIENKIGAVQDCRELHQSTLSSLKRSLSGVRSPNTKKLVDARAYLSAALTNKNTCLESLHFASGSLKPVLVNSVINTYKHVSNSLSELPKPEIRAPKGRKNRRLMTAPTWLSSKDRRLLRHHQNDRVFSPSAIRFYLAEILCALQHLHSMGIAYRDLKPENILIQQNGHVTLTDFDLSRKLTPKSLTPSHPNLNLNLPEPRRRHRRNFTRWIPLLPPDNGKLGLKKAKSARVSPVSRRKPSFSNGERSHSFVGTEEYVSPEVVRGEGHEFAVDWWALGILTYEMLYGTTPFKGKNRKETFRNVVAKRPEFFGERSAITDLIERLLEKEPAKRLGYARGASEIKEHAFFRGVQWDLLTEVVRPPFIPERDDGAADGNGGVDVREYLQRLKSPPSLPPSPVPSPSCKFTRNVSMKEF